MILALAAKAGAVRESSESQFRLLFSSWRKAEGRR